MEKNIIYWGEKRMEMFLCRGSELDCQESGPARSSSPEWAPAGCVEAHPALGSRGCCWVGWVGMAVDGNGSREGPTAAGTGAAATTASARGWHRWATPPSAPPRATAASSPLSLVSLCAPSSSEGFGIAEKIVLLSFISAVILMAILGNLLVMVAVCRDRQLR